MDDAPAHLRSVTVKPLIVTLGFEAGAQAHFEAERKRYFPVRLNRIPAHLSLFHALPGEEIGSISARLAALAAQSPSFPLQVHDLMRMGRGVAYALRSTELMDLHRTLQQAWLPWLTPQDRQPFHPHVVVQNKVDPGVARELYEKLLSGFRPWTAEAETLLLWHYEGGPWRLAAEFRLGEAAAA